jgi:molybdopterin-guanine dinucleotide biosynthesis protein A
MAINTTLKNSLQDYLAQGERKIDRWFEQHNWIKVDFSANPEFFSNINTLAQLADLAIKE